MEDGLRRNATQFAVPFKEDVPLAVSTQMLAEKGTKFDPHTDVICPNAMTMIHHRTTL